MSKQSNKKIFKYLALLLALTSVATPAISASAMGLNPVFKKQVTTQKDHELTDANTILIEKSLNAYLEYAPTAYRETPLYRIFQKNYWNTDFPSIDKSSDSETSVFKQMTSSSVFSTSTQTESDESSTLGDGSTNEIDFTQEKVTLASSMYMPLALLMQEYYTLFSNAKSFSETDPIPGETQIADTIDSEDMYNYFDLITAANSDMKNPHFSATERNSHLQGIANDLQESVDMLYQGDAADNQSSDVTKNYDGEITAFGDGDERPIYVSHDGYSYAQIVATYRKTPEIKSILKFEAALLDTMYAELQYVQDLHAGNNPKAFDQKKYVKRINDAYATLKTGLFASAQRHVKTMIHNAKELTEAQKWESKNLGEAGVNTKPSDITTEENLEDSAQSESSNSGGN